MCPYARRARLPVDEEVGGLDVAVDPLLVLEVGQRPEDLEDHVGQGHLRDATQLERSEACGERSGDGRLCLCRLVGP